MFVANSLDSSNQGDQVLKSVVGGSGARVVNPTTGMVIRLGMIYLDIVHSSEDFLATNQANQEGPSSQEYWVFLLQNVILTSSQLCLN